jgi:hypothetical protein
MTGKSMTLPESCHHRAILDVRQQERRDVGVVLDQVALGDAEPGPEGLVEIGERDLAPLHLQLRVARLGEVDGWH